MIRLEKKVYYPNDNKNNHIEQRNNIKTYKRKRPNEIK